MPDQFDIHPDDKVSFVKKIPPSIKFFAIVLLFILPLFLIWAVLTPFVQNRSQKPKYYFLPQNYNLAQLHRYAAQFRQDDEYQFYFTVLREPALSRATRDVYAMLEGEGKDALYRKITALHGRIEKMAGPINEAVYPADLSTDPTAYPELAFRLWDFLYEEFKLSLLGLVYRDRFDRDFFFVWSADAQQAARQVQKTIVEMKTKSRHQLEDFFLARKQSGAKP